MMIKTWLPIIALCGGLLCLSSCSSMMSHSGGKEGIYPGTRASVATIDDNKTSWITKSLAALDLPFTAVLDTVLLPWDWFRKDNSLKSSVEDSEKKNLAINSIIPPAAGPRQ